MIEDLLVDPKTSESIKKSLIEIRGDVNDLRDEVESLNRSLIQEKAFRVSAMKYALNVSVSKVKDEINIDALSKMCESTQSENEELKKKINS